MKTEKHGGITNVSAYSLDRIEAWCKEKCDDDGIWGLLEGHFKAVRLAQAPRVEEVPHHEIVKVIYERIDHPNENETWWDVAADIKNTLIEKFNINLKITTGEGEKR